MRGGNEEHRTRLRNAPGASRHDFAKEHVDDVADAVQEQIVLPVGHWIELLLARGLCHSFGAGRRRGGFLVGLVGHGGQFGVWSKREMYKACAPVRDKKEVERCILDMRAQPGGDG